MTKSEPLNKFSESKSKNNKKIIVPLVVIGVFLMIAGILWATKSPEPVQVTQAPTIDINEVVLYKTATCGCCVQYTSYLEENGYNVRMEIVDDLNVIHEQYNIPQEMASCHVAVWDNYFVEGHVPLTAIEKLVNKQPEIDGIALPGMPSGSPGMPGSKNEDWNIFQIADGKTSSFTVI